MTRMVHRTKVKWMTIKAAMITPNMALGGAERWVVDLIKHSDPSLITWEKTAVSGFGGADKGLLKELSKHTTLYANKPLARHRLKQDFYWEGIDHITGTDFRKTAKIVTADVDVIVTWGQPNLTYWLSTPDVPVVCVSHSTLREHNNPTVHNVTHLAAVSEKAMEYFDKRTGEAGKPRKVIYNGVNPERVATNQLEATTKADLGLKYTDNIVLYLGRFSPEKNCFAAARAVKVLVDKGFTSHHAVFYGWGPEEHDLRDWCERNIPDNFQIHPPITHIGNIINAATVLVLASHREAFSLTMIEAWLAECPVVATPVGSVPELQRKHGTLVFELPEHPTGKDVAIAIRAVEALDSRYELVQRARRLAERKLTTQHMVNNWTEYLTEVVNYEA